MARPPAVIGGGGGGGAVNVGVNVLVNYAQAVQGFQTIHRRGAAAFGAGGLGGTVRGLGVQFTTLDRVISFMAGGAIVAATAAFIKLASEMQRTSVELLALTGSLQEANQAMESLFNLAKKSPFSIQALTDAFAKFKSAGLDPLSGPDGSGALQAVSDAVAAFGGNTQVFERAVIGITQVAGKGSAQMEEFRQQIGEAIPSALRILAKELNMTMAEMVLAMSKGQIGSQEALDALFKGFEKAYGGIGELIKKSTLTGAWQTLQSNIEKTAVLLDRMGALNPLTAMLQMFADQVERLNQALATPAAAEAFAAGLEKILDVIGANSDKIGEFIAIMADVGRAIASTVGIIADLAAAAPPELLAAGLISLLTLGKVPLRFSILLATFAEQIANTIEAISNISKAFPKEILTYGLLGWLLFGRVGALAGFIVGMTKVISDWAKTTARIIVDTIGVAGLTIKNVLSGQDAKTAFGNALASVQAWEARLNAQRAKMPSIPDMLFGKNRDDGKEVGNRIDSAIKDFRAKIADIKKAREELAGKAQTPDLDVGLGVQQLRDFTRLADEAEQVQRKLLQAQGKPGDATRLQYKDSLENYKRMHETLLKEAAGYEQKATELAAQGNEKRALQERTHAQQKRAAAATVLKSYNEMAKGVEALATAQDKALGEKSSNKAARAAARLAKQLEAERDKIAKFKSDLEKFGKDIDSIEGRVFGVSESEQARREVIADFASFEDRLNDMAVSVGNLTHNERIRKEILEQILHLQDRLNGAQEAAIALAQEKVRWEMADAQKQRDRTLRDLDRDLGARDRDTPRNRKDMFNNALFGDMIKEIDSLTHEWEDKRDQLLDMIEETQREIFANPNSEDNANKEAFIVGLEQRITAYDEYYQYILSQEGQLSQATADMWTKTTNIIKDGIADAIMGLIDGSMTMKDALLQIYSAITRAAIEYIIKLIMIKMMQMATGFGGGGGGMIGAPTMTGAPDLMMGPTAFAANGMAFDQGIRKFARGGAFTNSIVSGPTLFNMGMMGEAGPEAIMPLKRGADGKLGVQASGRGHQNNYNVTIHAVDARSIRDLLLEHGDAIVPALVNQGRLNNGLGRYR